MTDKKVLDIVLATHNDAVAVINRLVQGCIGYGYVSVEDLYESVGFHGTYEDTKWGWSDLSDADVINNPQGWQLKLPKPTLLVTCEESKAKETTLEDRIVALEARVQSLETNTRNIF